MIDLRDPPEAGDADAYIQWLLNPDGGGYRVAIPIGDGRWVGIQALMFHWTMHVGRMDERSGHDERYCYKTFDLAVQALVDWALERFEGEPSKWHRHPTTGRRRPDGDETKEYHAS